VDFPPIASINARSDGSAASEQKVHEANARFALQLCGRLADSSVCDGEPVLVGCSSGARAALGGDALSLRDAKQALKICAGDKVVVVVSPVLDEEWDAATALVEPPASAAGLVVVNGQLSNGLLPHAYFYRPMSAFSAVTGGVARLYPGPYECFDASGERVELEVPLARQGARALPDTKGAQMALQERFGGAR